MTLAGRPKWWSTLSMREKILCGLTFGAVCYLFIVFLYQPRVAKREQLHNQRASLREEISRLTSTLETLRESASVPGDEIRVQATALINSGPMLSNLLKKIQNQARGQGVELLEIKPKVFENKEAFRILPLELKTRSRFQNLGRYLHSLERFSEPVVVDRINIRSDHQSGPEVVATISLHIYRGEKA